MSAGFLVELVNNCPSSVVFTAKVENDADWESTNAARPDVDLKNYPLAAFSSGAAFHEERANGQPARFTLEAAFASGAAISFVLHGSDADDIKNKRVATSGAEDYAVYQVTSHASEVGGSWPKMTIFITPRVSASKWMERLIAKDPTLTLAGITIPGTHESGTAGGNAEMGTRCQTMSIGDQLKSGIRFFDLRVKPYEDQKDLGIFHADYTQNLWLGKDVLPVISTFLTDNPNECVVLLFNHAVDGGASFDGLLHDLLVGNAAKNIAPGVAPNKLYDRDDATDLKLANLRGSVVLMRRDPEATFGIKAAGWPDDDDDEPITVGGAPMRIQDAYEYSQSAGSYIAQAKWPNVKGLLDAAKTTGSTWFVNFTSASHSPPTLGGYPLDVSGGDWGVNALLCRYLVTNPPFRGRLGTVVMDGPEEPGGHAMVCHLLIAMNEQL